MEHYNDVKKNYCKVHFRWIICCMHADYAYCAAIGCYVEALAMPLVLYLEECWGAILPRALYRYLLLHGIYIGAT